MTRPYEFYKRSESDTPYRIEPHSRFVEVHAYSDLSHWDVLKIMYHLWKNDPHKKVPDLWILAPDIEIALCTFPTIACGIISLATRNLKHGCRSAILVANRFQQCTLEFLRKELAALPYEIRIFTSREEAIQWLLEDQGIAPLNAGSDEAHPSAERPTAFRNVATSRGSR